MLCWASHNTRRSWHNIKILHREREMLSSDVKICDVLYLKAIKMQHSVFTKMWKTAVEGTFLRSIVPENLIWEFFHSGKVTLSSLTTSLFRCHQIKTNKTRKQLEIDRWHGREHRKTNPNFVRPWTQPWQNVWSNQNSINHLKSVLCWTMASFPLFGSYQTTIMWFGATAPSFWEWEDSQCAAVCQELFRGGSVLQSEGICLAEVTAGRHGGIFQQQRLQRSVCTTCRTILWSVSSCKDRDSSHGIK